MNRKIIFFVMITAIGLSTETIGQTKKEKEVAGVVEQLKKAMIDADSVALDHLVFNELSYGHSSGHIDDKMSFIHAFTSGTSDFVTIDLTEQTITVIKNTAIVRHILSATTNDSGKPGTVKLRVMIVLQKDKGQWKMLARQAVHV